MFHQIFAEHSLRSGPSYGHLILTAALGVGSPSDSDSKKLNSLFLCCSLIFSCNWRRFSFAHVNSDVSLNTEGSGREGLVKFSSRSEETEGGSWWRAEEKAVRGGWHVSGAEREYVCVCVCVCVCVYSCARMHSHTRAH